jgi:hypothetical protein
MPQGLEDSLSPGMEELAAGVEAVVVVAVVDAATSGAPSGLLLWMSRGTAH